MPLVITEQFLVLLFGEFFHAAFGHVVLAFFTHDPKVRLYAGLLIEILKARLDSGIFIGFVYPVTPVVLKPLVYRFALISRQSFSLDSGSLDLEKGPDVAGVNDPVHDAHNEEYRKDQ